MSKTSLVISIITLALFIAALFVKGLTHDIFLEAGVFLVSVKIILLGNRNRTAIAQLDKKLDTVINALSRENK
jgi:hypothetical protein